MYRLRWSRRAMDELADQWIQGDSSARDRITAAVFTVERRLRLDAAHEGESRESGRRILFEPPLAVTFRVERDGDTVSVIQVRVFREKR